MSDMELIRRLARQFSPSSLTQIADAADLFAEQIGGNGRAIMLDEETQDALLSFRGLALYARQVIALGLED